MEECFLDSPRGRTYYWIDRSGTPGPDLVFLPGLTATHRLFDPQTAYFSGRYPLLTWDAPAHGKSRPYRDFSYAHLAEELKAILDREGIERVCLVGQSAGGFVSQVFLSRWPERAAGFLSIDSCPFDPWYYSASDRWWLRQIEWMARCYPDRLLRFSIARICGATEAGRANMRLMLAHYGKRELCHLMYLGEAGAVPEFLELTISCPVLLTVGEKDRVGKVRQLNRRWSEREGHPLRWIARAAHNANVDQPAEMNRIIEEFYLDITKEL